MPKKYGITFPDSTTALECELKCIRWSQDGKEKFKNLYTGPGLVHHFKEASKILFPLFVWHPWAEAQLDACCRSTRVGIAGCSHIGKSEFAGIWSIINYLAAPTKTLVLVTSTTIAGAKKRVWSSIERYWMSFPGLPGKLTNSPSPQIALLTENGKKAESRGIHLIPSDAKKAGEASSKALGMKAERVFLVADELSELSDGLMTTALSNLNNNDYFHVVGMSNPNSYYDPFGKFVKPKNGWTSISVDDEEWETEVNGICLHLDALKSPNWILGENKWPILKIEKIHQALAMPGGDKSPEFWRMYRGFWCPSGMSQAIFSEVDIERFSGTVNAIWESNDLTAIAACDPSFTTGGDRTIVMFGKIGKTINGKRTVNFSEFIELSEDVTNKTEPRDFQIARQLKEECEKRGVIAKNCAIDATGSGISFASIVEQTWGKVLRIEFGGKASDLPVMQHDGKPGSEIFANRVTEIWYTGLEFLRSGQLSGMMPELVKEISIRQYGYGSNKKIKAESKDDMRNRGVRSPDIADAAMMLVTLARERFGINAGGVDGSKSIGSKSKKKLVNKYNDIYKGTKYA